MWFRPVLISLLYAALVSAHIQLDTDDVYIAGAVQWTPYGSSATPAAAVIDQNLAAFATQAQQAANQGVQVLVFDEGSLGMFWPQGLNLRDLTLPYCESFPSPTPSTISFVDGIEIQHFHAKSTINPCQGTGGNFSTTSQIYRLSCIARQARLILVVNTCDVQTCSSSTDPSCPADGRYQYNTQVVFNEQGDFIAKYHKSHLFSGDTAFNKPTPVAVTFGSSFGVTFGTFVCFDILYPAPAATLVKMGITHFIFSSWWLNFPPLFVATQQQQAWSRQHQVAVIAANTGSAPNESGGGIYIAGEPLVSLFKTSGPDATNVREILVAKIPKTFQRKLHVLPQPQQQPLIKLDAQPISYPMDIGTVACALGSVLGPTGNCTLFSPSQAGATFNLSVTSGTISCSAVLTSTTGVNETFGILAYQGQIHFPGATDPLSLEVCGIAQCKNAGVIFGYTVCESLFTAATIFSSFTITGSGFRNDTSLFPYLALSDAQIQDTSFLTFVETNNGTRVAQISNGQKN